MTLSYDDEYRNTEDLFGDQPEAVLTRFHPQLPRDRPVLDVGAGQGRNAIYLARNGFLVDAMDPSSVGLESVSAIAAAESLSIRTFLCTFDAFPLDKQRYGGVLLFGLIQILSWESIDALVHRAGEWLAPDGMVFVTCFTTEDSSYAKYSRQWARIGSHSYADEDGQVRTYLEPGRLPDLFAGYGVVHHWEGTGPEHRHGDGDLHRHAVAEAVLRR